LQQLLKFITCRLNTAASGLPSELGDSSAVGSCRAGWLGHDQQHCYHQTPTVN